MACATRDSSPIPNRSLTKPRRDFKGFLHRSRYWKSNPRNYRALN